MRNPNLLTWQQWFLYSTKYTLGTLYTFYLFNFESRPFTVNEVAGLSFQLDVFIHDLGSYFSQLVPPCKFMKTNAVFYQSLNDFCPLFLLCASRIELQNLVLATQNWWARLKHSKINCSVQNWAAFNMNGFSCPRRKRTRSTKRMGLIKRCRCHIKFTFLASRLKISGVLLKFPINILM